MPSFLRNGIIGVKTSKMSDNGRIVIPSRVRHELGIKAGDVVYWEVTDGIAQMATRSSRLRHAQRVFSRLLGQESTQSLADELIAERRREAATQ
jgi:AbrB family looped-hinge helix DNA binding protein